jgi:hypothetical protein
MAVALALAAVPVWLLTQSEAPSASAVPAATPPPLERELTLEIESAPTAQAIGVTYLGRELIPQTPAGGRYFGSIRLPATSTVDLVVTARWTGTSTAALRVRVANDDGPVAEASYWGTDHVEDVFTIPETQQ